MVIVSTTELEVDAVDENFKDAMMSMALLDLPPTSCQFSFMARPVSFRRLRIRN